MLALPGCRRGEADEMPAARTAQAAEGHRGVHRDSLYGARAVENLRVVPVELELRGIPRGWDGMRIAVLSDLLIGLWPDNAAVAEAAVTAAVDANPDLIVFLGDFVAPGADLRALDAVLRPISGRQALAVLGDRDLLADTAAAGVAARLRAGGVTLLRNQVVAFSRGADTAYIAGVDPDGVAAGQASLFEGLPEGAATPLLLAHLPTVLPRLPANRFPVVLSGGTFCGDIDVPGSPRLATLQQETLAGEQVPRRDRLFRSGGNTLFVTCGVGYTFVPTRLAAPPEVAVVTLIRIPEPRTEARDTAPLPPEPEP